MPKKIALIEDDKVLVKMYKEALERAGFVVAEAYDGEAGLNLIQKEMPDLILLDLRLPKMDGFEMMKRMKSDPQVNKIPIIILTNYSTDQNIAQAVELGANEFNIKTDFTPGDIVLKVQNLLSEGK